MLTEEGEFLPCHGAVTLESCPSPSFKWKLTALIWVSDSTAKGGSCQMKNKNWLETAVGPKIVEDLTSSRPWDSFYTHCVELEEPILCASLIFSPSSQWSLFSSHCAIFLTPEMECCLNSSSKPHPYPRMSQTFILPCLYLILSF